MLAGSGGSCLQVSLPTTLVLLAGTTVVGFCFAGSRKCLPCSLLPYTCTLFTRFSFSGVPRLVFLSDHGQLTATQKALLASYSSVICSIFSFLLPAVVYFYLYPWNNTSVRLQPSSATFSIHQARKTERGFDLEAPQGLPFRKWRSVLGHCCAGQDDG